jgi:formate transporter
VLGILAGVYIGFGALLMLCCGGNCPGIASTDPGLKALLSGLIGLPCGLLMVLISGAELFTGNTALVTAAHLEGKASLMELTKSWIVSWIGNLVGSLALAAAAVAAGLLVTNPSVIAVATAKTSMTWGVVSFFLLFATALV